MTRCTVPVRCAAFSQHTVETLVGRKIIADEVLPGTTLVVDCENDQLVVR